MKKNVAKLMAGVMMATTLLGTCTVQAEEVDYKFAYICNTNHVFNSPMPAAIEAVCADLGLDYEEDVVQITGDGTVETMMNNLDAMVAAGVNGIACDVADRSGQNVKVTELMEQGVPVVNFASTLEEPTDAVVAYATDVGEAAKQGAIELITAMGGKGNIVHLSGNLNDANTVVRMEAIDEVLKDYPDVTLYKTIPDVDNAANCQNAVSALLASDADNIDGILATGWNSSVGLATVLRERNEDRIVAVGCDTDEVVLEAIKDGYMYGTMSQNPYGQAYACIYTLKKLADGYTYKEDLSYTYNSGFYLINAENVEQTDALAEAATEELLGSLDALFDAPAN